MTHAIMTHSLGNTTDHQHERCDRSVLHLYLYLASLPRISFLLCWNYLHLLPMFPGPTESAVDLTAWTWQAFGSFCIYSCLHAEASKRNSALYPATSFSLMAPKRTESRQGFFSYDVLALEAFAYRAPVSSLFVQMLPAAYNVVISKHFTGYCRFNNSADYLLLNNLLCHGLKNISALNGGTLFKSLLYDTLSI